MTIQEYLRVIARHWRLLGLVTLLFTVAALGVTMLMPKVYTTTTTEFVRGVPGSGATADYQAAQFATARAKSYSVMIGNPDVLSGVISDLDLSMSPTEVFQRLSVDNPVDTALINVTARGRTPDEAQALSNAAATNLAKLIVRLESAGIASGKSPIDVQVAVPAPQPTSPSSPKLSLDLALGFMLGLAIGSIAALMADMRASRDPVTVGARSAGKGGQAATEGGQAEPASKPAHASSDSSRDPAVPQAVAEESAPAFPTPS